MRVLLCGNDEERLLRLAHGLREAASDLEPVVLAAGQTEAGEYELEKCGDSDVSVYRARRADLHPTHWHKSISVSVRESLREILGTNKFDLVHVLSWRGLTRDLVATANAVGVPSVVSLLDDWTNCLLPRRVKPEDAASGKPCSERHSAGACLSCARSAEPRTDWVPVEAEFLAFAERSAAVKKELELAGAILMDSEASAVRMGQLGDALSGAKVVIAETRATPELLGLYDRVVTAARDEGSEPQEPVWYEERMQRFAEEEWDKKCREAEA